ncbi:MAG: transglutaminaseTgpA domain-containing protein [Cyanobacteria bacterium P01_C01_bin.118]
MVSPSSNSNNPPRGLNFIWRQRRLALPPSASEDSILLRVMVQCLVAVGICSLSIAAAGVTDTSVWNLLAIPLSAAGAYWSWRSRRRRNIAAKFLIALGMLAALAFFLGRMLQVPGDTRIVLAELLIHLQVLHSFDLPRRKDLGYSMMIGLVLVGVAATISQTLLFGPFLLLFFLLALPVLVLDYRSRLGLLDWRRVSVGLPIKQLAGIILLILALGLAIFVAMPRVPGYQLQTFPVSGSVDVTADADSRQIFNPGYVSRGNNESQAANENENGGTGISPETGPGRISTDFYYGFNRRINQNLRGELEPQVVMRVRSQQAGFWRVMAFDQYTGQGWDTSRSESLVKLGRSPLSYRFLPIGPQVLGPTREVVQTYTMVQDFQNLVPVLYAPESVYFPSEELSMDPEGTLRPPGPLPEGLTYTVVSQVPLRNAERLNQSSTDYKESIRQHYLQVPGEIRDRIRTETERWLATSETPLNTPYEKATFLTQVLRENYTIETELPYFEENEDLVSAFLFKYQGGTRDQFSTVLTVMLRSIDIPARLATGFGPGQFNAFTGFYIVRNTDAYAQTEVYFPGAGWFYFNPIPNSLLFSPEEDSANPFSVLRQLWRILEGVLPTPVIQIIQRGFRILMATIGALLQFLTRFSGQGWLGVIWGALGLTGAGFVGWLSWQGWRRWQRQLRLSRLAPAERLYQQLLWMLSQRGYGKRTSQTPLEYAAGLQRRSDFRHGALVRQMIERYVGWRYGNHPLDLDGFQGDLQTLKRSGR